MRVASIGCGTRSVCERPHFTITSDRSVDGEMARGLASATLSSLEPNTDRGVLKE